MNKVILIPVFLLLNTLFFACNTSSWLPSKTEVELQSYVNTVDEVDIVLLQKGVSLNGAKRMAYDILSSMKLGDIKEKPSCPQIATAYIKSQGEQVGQIGVFLGADCAYYVFYEDDKPTHANWMAEDGVRFFNKFLQQINTTPQ